MKHICEDLLFQPWHTAAYLNILTRWWYVIPEYTCTRYNEFTLDFYRIGPGVYILNLVSRIFHFFLIFIQIVIMNFCNLLFAKKKNFIYRETCIKSSKSMDFKLLPSISLKQILNTCILKANVHYFLVITEKAQWSTCIYSKLLVHIYNKRTRVSRL